LPGDNSPHAGTAVRTGFLRCVRATTIIAMPFPFAQSLETPHRFQIQPGNRLAIAESAPHRPIQHRPRAAVLSEPVRDFAIIMDVEAGEVGVFSRLDRSFSFLQPERVRAVDGGR